MTNQFWEGEGCGGCRQLEKENDTLMLAVGALKAHNEQLQTLLINIRAFVTQQKVLLALPNLPVDFVVALAQLHKEIEGK